MRRLVHHAAIGLGCSALVVTAAVAGLGSPAATGTAIAVPAPVATQAQSLEGASDSSHHDGGRADRDAAVRGAAARKQSTADAVTQALERNAALISTSRSISRQQAKIVAQQKAAATVRKVRAAEAQAAAAEARAARKARAKAVATQEKAEAARARAAAAREEAAARAAAEARQARVRAQGYEPGTTDPREIARQILANTFGYGADQFDCFNNIIIRESGWVVDATNASSGAYGIPQALPGSKMATVADDWRTNPATQIIWAVGYMDDRYGSPCSAWSFKSANGWY